MGGSRFGVITRGIWGQLKVDLGIWRYVYTMWLNMCIHTCDSKKAGVSTFIYSYIHIYIYVYWIKNTLGPKCAIQTTGP